MKKRQSSLQIVIACILLIGVGLGVARCASPSSVAQPPELAIQSPVLVSAPPIPTPENAIYNPPYDKPSYIVGEQSVWGFLVTPLPDEKVHVGAITEFVPPVPNQQQSRYAIREDIPPWQPITEPDQDVRDILVKKLFVQDSVTGQEIRLGDGAGHALFQMMTSEYVIWRYQWNGWAETNRKTGLYAHVLETGEEIVIARQPDADPWHPEFDGQWVLYVDGQNASIYFINLRVHNLATDEDFLVGNKVPHYGRPASDYYATVDGKIAWVENDSGWTVRVYDLTTRTTQILDVPNTSSPANLSISDGIVVWWDRFWRGYDLEQDAVFTIPTIPPGWENVSTQLVSRVTVKDDQLYWALEVNGEIHHFTAPIIRSQ